MDQGSSARRSQRNLPHAGHASATSRPSRDLGGALAMAESGATHETDPALLVDPNRGDPGRSASSVEDPTVSNAAGLGRPSASLPTRSHLEDEFFAQGDDIGSLRPATLDPLEIELDERAARLVPTPRVLARRARLRRIVGSIVGAAGLLVAIGAARVWLARAPKTVASENALSVPNRVVPSIALAEESAQGAAVEKAPEAFDPIVSPSAPEPEAHHRLPVVDLEIPAAPDPATDRAWENAARSLSAQDFSAADRAFADLGRQADPATRETARLARAVWWMANGKHAEVRPVIADLAAHATTPYVQDRARELLSAN